MGANTIVREQGWCSRFLTHRQGQTAAFCSCWRAGIWARQLQESGWEDRQAKWCCARGILCDFPELVQTQEQCCFVAIFHQKRNLGFFPQMLNFESFLSAYQSSREPGLPAARERSAVCTPDLELSALMGLVKYRTLLQWKSKLFSFIHYFDHNHSLEQAGEKAEVPCSNVSASIIPCRK